MKMIRDRTGRFRERPYYESGELDVECEQIVEGFLREQHGKVEWPISTDDLTKLLEERVDDLDLYADLSILGPEVEGVTDFVRGSRPNVRIASELALHPSHGNRLRTTLTHEFGHVHFHGYLFQVDEGPDLFSVADRKDGNATKTHGAPSQQCRRETILDARDIDWMEWQAGYACGALLMPATPLRALAREFFRTAIRATGLTSESDEGVALIEAVMDRFDVSRDAARVRLLKTGNLLGQAQSKSLFE